MDSRQNGKYEMIHVPSDYECDTLSRLNQLIEECNSVGCYCNSDRIPADIEKHRISAVLQIFINIIGGLPREQATARKFILNTLLPEALDWTKYDPAMPIRFFPVGDNECTVYCNSDDGSASNVIKYKHTWTVVDILNNLISEHYVGKHALMKNVSAVQVGFYLSTPLFVPLDYRDKTGIMHQEESSSNIKRNGIHCQCRNPVGKCDEDGLVGDDCARQLL